MKTKIDHECCSEAPEKMAEFFENRLDIYEKHQMEAIACADVFYPLTAQKLPKQSGAQVLDLGAGTGLELGFYYPLNKTAKVTCVDLSPKMLDVLKKKFSEYSPKIICGSYFDIEFEEEKFDAVVSVESLHHFTYAEKVILYKKIRRALKKDGVFILTDYMEDDEIAEKAGFERKNNMLSGLNEEGVFWHIDTPLTVEHEMQALIEGGFCVTHCGRWGKTSLLEAYRIV